MTPLFDIPTKSDGIIRDARFTKSGDRRFLLTRRWVEDPEAPYVLFVMLNPSTANDRIDDPTIRKCMNFARDWGVGAIRVVNLFDFVTPSPKALMAWAKANGEIARDEGLYLDIIRDQSAGAETTVCGWGTWGGWFPERVRAVYSRLDCPWALHITKDGHPGHPLYLPKDLTLVPYTLPE